MDDSQYQHMCLMQTNNFYKYKPHSRFFQNVLLVACDGVSKPRTGGWKTTKNCTDFRQVNTFVWRLSPGACRRQQPGSCSPRRGRGRLRQRGPLPPSPVGIPAPELLPLGAAPGAARAQRSPAQRSTRFRAQSLHFLQKPFDFSCKAPMNPFKCKLALHF